MNRADIDLYFYNNIGSPTIAPTPTNVIPKTCTEKHTGFDFSSFVGGMVLVVGIIVLAFVGLRIQKRKAQSEDFSYHEMT